MKEWEFIWGFVFLAGGITGFLAVMLSILWHHLDSKLADLEPGQGETFEELDRRWHIRCRVRDVVRIAGLWMMYISLVALSLAAVGMGVDMYLGRAING